MTDFAMKFDPESATTSGIDLEENSRKDVEQEAKPHDSKAELSVSRGITWWEATGSLVIVVIGAGVMALPLQPHSGGVVPSFLAMALCGYAITESGMALWKGFMTNNLNSEKKIISYEDFGRKALGDTGELLVGFMLIFYFLGVASGFLVLIAESLAHLTGVLEPTQWVFIISPGIAVLALLPNVTAIARLVPLAVVSVFGLCFLIIGKSLLDSQRWHEWTDIDLVGHPLHKQMPDTFMDLGTVVASLFGAFGANGNVPTILCEMQDQAQFPFAYRTAMVIVASIYALVMGCGYYAYGEFMQRDIVDSLESFPANANEAFNVPFDEWTGAKAEVLPYIASSFLLVKLVIALPLNLMVIFNTFQTVKYTENILPVGSWNNRIMRISTVAVAVFISTMIPDFSTLFAFACSILGPLLQCVCPLLFSFLIRKKFDAKMSSPLRRVIHMLITLLSIFTITIGFWESLQDILHPADV